MKVIIPLAGYGKRMRPHTWSRAKPLLHVAGHTIIGHLLNRMHQVTMDEVYFVVGYKGDEIEAWIRAHYPHLKAHFVEQAEPLGQAHAIWMCRNYLDDGEVLVAFGDGIVEADYLAISETDADGVCLVQPMDDPRTFGVVVTDAKNIITDFIEKPETTEHKNVIAGIYWFRNGRMLRDTLDTVIAEDRRTKGEYYLVDAYRVMLEQGARIEAKPVTLWLDAGKPDYILTANARILSLGYGSEDAIERSYAEDFTVLPPVFVHETAVVENSVIGPYVSIGPNAVVRQCVVRNSIIDAGAAVERAILEDSLIGENARIAGSHKKLFIGDDSIVDLG